MMLSAAMRDSIDKGTASQIANAFKNNALFLNMDDDSFLEMMNFATQGTPHHDIVVMLSSGLIYESLDITHFVLTNFAQYMEKPSLVRIIHEFIYDILQIDGSRFIIDSPLNYIVGRSRYAADKHKPRTPTSTVNSCSSLYLLQ